MAKFEIQLTETKTFAFGYNAKSHGMLTTLSGHPAIEGIEIARFGGGTNPTTYREICSTCRGTGFRPEYAGVYGGQCFYCNATGLGKVYGTGTALEVARKIKTRVQAAARRDAKRVAKIDAERTAHRVWLDANPEIAAIAAEFGNIGRCEHGWDCGRENCYIAAQEARDLVDPTLLSVASQALCRPISPTQEILLVQLVAENTRRVAAREAKAAKVAERGWVGQQGEKVSVTGVLTFAKHIESHFGTSTLYKVTTAEGDVASWFRTGYHEAEQGATITLTGTVKKCEQSDKYGKETVLTRCKIS
jgi:hypothetical protein